MYHVSQFDLRDAVGKYHLAFSFDKPARIAIPSEAAVAAARAFTSGNVSFQRRRVRGKRRLAAATSSVPTSSGNSAIVGDVGSDEVESEIGGGGGDDDDDVVLAVTAAPISMTLPPLCFCSPSAEPTVHMPFYLRRLPRSRSVPSPPRLVNGLLHFADDERDAPTDSAKSIAPGVVVKVRAPFVPRSLAKTKRLLASQKRERASRRRAEAAAAAAARKKRTRAQRAARRKRAAAKAAAIEELLNDAIAESAVARATMGNVTVAMNERKRRLLLFCLCSFRFLFFHLHAQSFEVHRANLKWLATINPSSWGRPVTQRSSATAALWRKVIGLYSTFENARSFCNRWWLYKSSVAQC